MLGQVGMEVNPKCGVHHFSKLFLSNCFHCG